MPAINRIPAIILCGGRGSRLGPVTAELPKSLVDVHGKPLLWYIFLTLHTHGIRHFILPIGYKGDLIRDYVNNNLPEFAKQTTFVETGIDTPIAKRLSLVLPHIKDMDDFLMVNGDTYFDFPLVDMLDLHIKSKAQLTVSSISIESPYGLIIESEGEIIDFSRKGQVSHVVLKNSGEESALLKGYINSGITILSKSSLEMVDLDNCENLEHELFPLIIRSGRMARYAISGSWYAVDTMKDLDTINLGQGAHDDIGVKVKQAKSNLISRYSYRTRYIEDVDVLKQQILDKTVIPHQVEVQPGPITSKEICWLKCPYCYGGSAENTKERLTPERYLDILHQIADGGVKKIIFAGYATDPLFYEGIDDLLQIPVDRQQVFGFHTKALRFTDRFVKLVTNPDIMPLSYFSVSVDAGENQNYNTVHGIPKSRAKLYDKVLTNIGRLAEARARTGAPLDISTTYLLNSFNSSEDEVAKAIDDLRAAGSDLIRFTFPQKPRGYTEELADFIPQKEAVLESYERLRPIIESKDGDGCEVLILDLDTDYDTHGKLRTLPCIARFIFPSIGYDGYLAHCSESAAPHFREMSFGSLAERDFWDAFYDYPIDDFTRYFENAGALMDKLGCRCDRKEHAVNSIAQKSGFLDRLDAAE